MSVNDLVKTLRGEYAKQMEVIEALRKKVSEAEASAENILQAIGVLQGKEVAAVSSAKTKSVPRKAPSRKQIEQQLAIKAKLQDLYDLDAIPKATDEEVIQWAKDHPKVPVSYSQWVAELVLAMAPKAIHSKQTELAVLTQDPDHKYRSNSARSYLKPKLERDIITLVGGSFYMKSEAARTYRKSDPSPSEPAPSGDTPAKLSPVTAEHVMTIIRLRGPSSAVTIKHTLRNTRPDVNGSEEGVARVLSAMVSDRRLIFKDNLYHDNSPFGKG